MSARRLPTDSVALLLRQFADASRAGLAPPDAMALLRRHSSAAVRCPDLVAALTEVTESRASWAQALGRFPASFPPETADLLAHAQQQGQLPAAMELLAQEFEQRASLLDSLRGALAWPAFVGGFLIVLLTVLMVFVVPEFEEVFRGFGADLPAPTMFVIGVSELAVQWGWLVIAAAVLVFVVRRLRGRTARTSTLWSALVLRVPVLGPYLSASFLLRAGRLLIPVVEGRLPAAPVVAYLRASTDSTVLAAQARALEAALASGSTLADAVRNALARGGDVALAMELDQREPGRFTALKRALELAADDLARKRVGLEQVAVGATYALTGLIVGTFVISMYLPIFKLGALI